MHIPLGTVSFREGVEFAFPSTLCCNCGARSGLRIISQDTRRTTYLLAGGTELTFRLPLPFCERCSGSAKRRPKNLAHRVLLFGLAFVGWFATLVVLGESGTAPLALAKYTVHLAIALAAASTLLVVYLARPSAGQSSYYQPVRISRLKREFLSGAVTAIGFAFTNHDYARAFAEVNHPAIARMQLFVEET